MARSRTIAGIAPADAGAAQCPERARRDRRGGGDGDRRRGDRSAASTSFGGVKRRFTKVGEVDGITIIDDYGHHPVEIAAVLAAAREGVTGRVIAVVQPHRYTRLHDLMAEFQGAFNDADIVLVAPVYAAGEAPIEGVSHESLVEGLKQRGHLGALAAADPHDVCPAAGRRSPRRAT